MRVKNGKLLAVAQAMEGGSGLTERLITELLSDRELVMKGLWESVLCSKEE